MHIRRALRTDLPSVLSLMRQLASYERLDPPDDEAAARLERDALAENPPIELWVAEIRGEIAAYAVTYPTYSTFRARPGLYLEDLFVAPHMRRRGIATAILKHLRHIAAERRCGRFEWLVLDWNRDAQALYRNAGASILPDWRLCRVDLP